MLLQGPIFLGLFSSECQRQRFPSGNVLSIGDPRHVEHPLGGDDPGSIGVFVLHKDHFLDAALDDGFGAFVAGKEGDVDRGPFERTAVIVQNGV